MASTRRTTTKKTETKKTKRMTAPRKKTVKKVAKKTAKKVTKKAKRTTVAKKPSPKKITSKPKRGVIQNESKNQKLLPKFPTSITLRTHLSLAALSPYRLPLDVDKVALNTARVAGLAFAFLLGVFTFVSVKPVATQLVSYVTVSEQTAQVHSVSVEEAEAFLVDEAGIRVNSVGPDGTRLVSLLTKNIVTTVRLSVIDVTSGTSVSEIEMQPVIGISADGTVVWQALWNISDQNSGNYRLQALLTKESFVGPRTGVWLTGEDTYQIGFASAR